MPSPRTTDRQPRQEIYIDGQLNDRSKPRPSTILRSWLGTLEAHWRRDPGATVTRLSPDELVIVGASGVTIRAVNVEPTRGGVR